MQIGYARVSTDAQDLTTQRELLAAAGCQRIFAEKITGTRADRPELARMIDHLRAGDVVTVTSLDRLARSTRDLLDIAERLQAIGAGLRSLSEPWADTTSPAGKMVLTVFAGIAEFERSLIVERTRRGVQFGRRPALTPAQVSHARELLAEGRAVPEVAALLNVHRATLYRVLARGEEVTKTEARRRGAFAEDALSEADALAAVDDERQEEGPAFLDDDGPSSDLPIPPHRNSNLPEVLAGLSDDELAAWPGALADHERARRKSRK
ncbi:recombinase family protein [Proteus mirabilis]|uniref:recombinase family protein n=1 Tax=Proteus mirabilis TaxID=584 RepID=UPI003314E617